MRFDPLSDGLSSVELLNSMGDDLMVVNAARVSMHKESAMAWNQESCDFTLNEADVKLVNYLAKHNHWTPFSHPQVQLRIKMPIFIARQWYKHMVGLTRNEVSRRYVDDVPEYHYPGHDKWRLRAVSVKQGSSEEVKKGMNYLINGNNQTPNSLMKLAVGLYNEMIKAGVCPEQARMVLPQAMYTEFIETGSLAAYARIAKLRLDPHAQKEVRQYAEAVSKIMAELFPVSWQALLS